MKKADLLHNTLPYITRASRYLGNEINAVKKDLSQVDLKFALAFPDAYEVGMSHLGMHILYHVLNSRDDIACERVFALWPDMESAMRMHNQPLTTLESGIALVSCDILGFSLEYELSYATVLRMLHLAGIPLLSRERDESYPLVIAGGPSMFNPEPVADFFDAIVIGEGEEVVIEICDAYLDWKKRKAPKRELLDMLSEIQGVYIPSFFTVTYTPEGTVKEITALKKGYDRIEKRVITGFSDAPFCTAPVVPYLQIIHDRAAVEIARGCSRGCRFCMAGMIYRPVREKGLHKIIELAQKTLKNTGYEELSLASLSSGDHSEISDLLRLIMRYCKKDTVAVSFPSLRVGSLTSDLINEIKQVRKTGFTIAPEAGTQRLRNVINKGITEQEILKTASEIFSSGWNLVKLYFMIGLPTETQSDIAGIVDMSTKIRHTGRRLKTKRLQVNVSVSTFVPKAHTPFQWEQQDPPDKVRAKQQYLKANLPGKAIRFKWHNHNLSFFEGVFSRGDRRLCDALIKAHQMGAGFEGWTEYFNPELWNTAFARCNLDTHFYLRQRDADECLPWSHISSAVQTDFLKREREKALREETTPDCRHNDCSQCGACNSPGTHLERSIDHPAEENRQRTCPPAPPALPRAPHYRYRLYFSKTGPACFLSHLELNRSFARAMRRAGIALRYSSGFHPQPRIIFYDALPVGIESRKEFLDVELTERCDPVELTDVINRRLPEGLSVLAGEEIDLKNNPLADSIKKYIVSFPALRLLCYPDAEEIKRCLNQYNSTQQAVITTQKKGQPLSVDIKDCVRNIGLRNGNTLEIEIDTLNKKVPRVVEIVEHILHLGEREKKALRITKL